MTGLLAISFPSFVFLVHCPLLGVGALRTILGFALNFRVIWNGPSPSGKNRFFILSDQSAESSFPFSLFLTLSLIFFGMAPRLSRIR